MTHDHDTAKMAEEAAVGMCSLLCLPTVPVATGFHGRLQTTRASPFRYTDAKPLWTWFSVGSGEDEMTDANVAGTTDYTLSNPDTLTKYKTAAQISHKVLEAVTGKRTLSIASCNGL